MFVVFFIIALSRTFGASMPMISNDTINPRDEPQLVAPVSPQTYRLRTRFEIIWSCVATLFICTWIAIHPNIPPRDEGHVRSLWGRIKLMLCTLVVPELILIWAYKQWAAARYIAEVFKDEGWTPSHGHFLIMGGFTLARPAGGERVLSFRSFFALVGIPEYSWLEEPLEIDFPTITAAEIQDKARGDFLSKAIVILQSTWFIVQCIARRKQGLALTELELVTLALASLNGVMYYFWWDKPLGVKEPIKIYPIGVNPPKKARIESAGRLDRIGASLQISLVQRFLLRPLRRIPSAISRFLEHFHSILSSCSSLLSSVPRQLPTISLSNIKMFLDDQRGALYFPGHQQLWFLYLPIYWLSLPIFALGETLAKIADTTEIYDNASHVSTFYAPAVTVVPEESTNLYAIHLPIVAVIFGALHLIAWKFHFPSHVEQLLWRIGSLALTIIPSIPLALVMLSVIVFPFILILKALMKTFRVPNLSVTIPRNWKTIFEAILMAVGGFLVGTTLVAYMLARLLLLTQAVFLLRKQPESAFYAINWSHFFPHI